jgi:DNA polymerase epsilon subunit 1
VGADPRAKQMPNINKLYLDKYQQVMPTKESQTLKVKDSMDFATTYHKTELDAFKAINKQLLQLNERKQGPTILVINSPRQANYLAQKVSAINSFPFVTVPSHQQDNQFDLLSWLTPVCKQMLAYYMHLGSWLDERFNQSRYTNVPFCNIPNDPYLFMADFIFAKQLISNDMLLWWSSAQKPDLGGRENDENATPANELINNEINNPGTYETVCVELDILRLCLNTLIMAPVVNEVEGVAATVGFDNTTLTLDEYSKGVVKHTSAFGDATISSKTFTVLRAMVQQWFQEVMADNNTMSVLLQDTLLRWLLSPLSNLYDPCLYGLVQGMMKKVFMQLVAEFRRLGAKVVFANFRRIIIATSKESMDGAIAYWQYLSRSIQRKQVLEVLELKKVNYWQVLVWMDEMNYGGFLANETPPLGQQPAQGHVVTMRWNICDYLAPAIQEQFKISVAQFIQKLLLIKEKYPRDIKYQINQQKQHDDSIPDPRNEQKRRYIRQTMMREVLQWLPKLMKQQEQALGENDNPDMVFPRLAGSHLKMTNPALEFVKSLAAVLSLDPLLDDEVRVLKRNALEIVGDGAISEFSSEAQFQNPCEFLKLNEVVCAYCGYTEDLDICRDHHLMKRPGQHNQASVWRCRGCKVPYNKNLIEESMITQVNRWMMMYQLQDLMCQRCHSVKRENLLRQCDKCGSDYVTVQSKQDVMRKLKVFGNVANDQQLSLLQNIIQWTMERI